MLKLKKVIVLILTVTMLVTGSGIGVLAESVNEDAGVEIIEDAQVPKVQDTSDEVSSDEGRDKEKAEEKNEEKTEEASDGENSGSAENTETGEDDAEKKQEAEVKDLVLKKQTLKAKITDTPKSEAKPDERIKADSSAEITLKGRMPEGAYVKAFPVKVKIPGQNVLTAYDITIYVENSEGKETVWQPEKALSVSIKDSAIRDAAESANKDEINVYHMEDKDAKPEHIKENDLGGESISFDADSFSVYAVTEDSKVPMRRYIFTDESGKVLRTVKLKNGETLGVPTAEPEEDAVFAGWFYEGYKKNDDGTITGREFNSPIEMSGENAIPETSVGDKIEEVKIVGIYRNVYYVTFVGFDGHVEDTLKVKRGETIDVSAVTYTPPAAYRFLGWSTKKGKSEASDVMDDKYRVDGNATIYPVLAAGFFVSFDTNAMGGRATYVDPAFVAKNSDIEGSVNAANAKPERKGYAFTGWYSEKECTNKVFDADVKLVDEKYRKLTRSLNLYAGWEKAAATYQIMYFRQLATDTPDMADDEKHYEFLQASTIQGVKTGDSVSYGEIADHDELTEDYRDHFTVNASKSKLNDIVKSDGSTVLKVYLDRKTYTITFKRSDKYAKSSKGKFGLWLGDEQTGKRIKYSLYSSGEKDFEYGFYDTTNRSDNNNPWYYKNRGYNVTPALPEDRYVSTADYPVFDGKTYGEETLPDLTIRALYGAYIADKWPSYNTEHYFSSKWLTEEDGKPAANIVKTGMAEMPGEDRTYFSVRLATFNESVTILSEWRKKGAWTSHNEYYIAKDSDNAGKNLDDYVLDSELLSKVGAEVFYTSEKKYRRGFEQVYFQGNTEQNKTELQWINVADVNENNKVCSAKAGKDNIHNAESDTDTVIRFFYKRIKYPVNFVDSLDKTVNYNNSVTRDGKKLADKNGEIKAYFEYSLSDLEPDVSYKPVKEGYEFTGWYEDEACTVPFDFDEAIQGDRETMIYAGWKANWHIITIDPNGGELADGDSTWIWKKYGENINEYKPVREYVADPAGEYSYIRFYYPGDKLDSDNRTRKAKYVKTSEADQFIRENQTDASNKYERIDGFRKLDEDEQDTWTFLGWYWTNPSTGVEEKYDFKTPVRCDAEIKAKWRSLGNFSIEYVVKDEQGNPYKDKKGNDIAAAPDDAVYSDGSYAIASVLSAAPADGKFLGWKTADGSMIQPNDTFLISRKIAELIDEKKANYKITLTAVIGDDENHGANTQRRNMYSFYVAEDYSSKDIEPYYVEYISPGEELTQPKTPEDPAGEGRTFTGWYTDKELRNRFDGFGVVDEPSDGTKLYASFTRQHHVRYFDKTGDNLITTQSYADGAFLNTSGVVFTDTEPGMMTDGWAKKGEDEVYAAYGRATKTRVTRDLDLYPKQVARKVLNFDTNGGSFVDPVALTSDRIPAKPDKEPVKAGYKFKWWSTEKDSSLEYDRFWFEEEEDKPELEYGVLPEGQDTLYAVWELDTENPIDADYNIVWWVQNADKSGYDIASTKTVSTTVGRYSRSDAEKAADVTLNDKSNMGSVVAENDRKFFEFNDSKSDKSVEVTPDGKATFNMYFDRTEYTLKFDPNGTGSTFTYKDGNGTQHTGEKSYEIKGWFEMPLPKYWPIESHDGINEAKLIVGGSNTFRGWVYERISGSKLNCATTQKIVDRDMCDAAIRDNGTLSFSLECGSKKVNEAYFNVEYWFRDSENSKYEKDPEMDQTIVAGTVIENGNVTTNLEGKDFAGYGKVEKTEIDGWEKKYYTVWPEGYRHYYYADDSRNTIRFYYTAVKNGLSLCDASNPSKTYYSNDSVPFGTKLKPILDAEAEKLAVPEGKKFGGWSTSNVAKSIVDDEKTMPAGNVRLYAWWDEADVTITTKVEGVTPDEKYTKTYGTALGDFGLTAPGNVNGLQFGGWKLEGTGDDKVLDSTFIVKSDITLVPVASPVATIRVSYDFNGGHYESGAPMPENTTPAENGFIDNNSYNNGGSPIVVSGDGLTKGLGSRSVHFICWNTEADGSGTDYYAGDSVSKGVNLTKDVTLYAKYSMFHETKLRYDANGGSFYKKKDGTSLSDIEIDFIDYETAVKDAQQQGPAALGRLPNTDYVAGTTADNEEFAAKRPGFRFAGWDTDKNGTGIFQSGDILAVDTIDGDNNVLYAIWEEVTLPVEVYEVALGRYDKAEEISLKSGKNNLMTASGDKTAGAGFAAEEWYNASERNAVPAEDVFGKAVLSGSNDTVISYVRFNADACEWQYAVSEEQPANDSKEWRSFGEKALRLYYYPEKAVPEVHWMYKDKDSGALTELTENETDPKSRYIFSRETPAAVDSTAEWCTEGANQFAPEKLIKNTAARNGVLLGFAVGAKEAAGNVSELKPENLYKPMYLKNTVDGLRYADSADDIDTASLYAGEYAVYAIYGDEPLVNLNINNSVKGQYADLNKEFEFKLYVDGASDQDSFQGVISNKNNSGGTVKILNSGESFKLGDGKSLSIMVPADTKITLVQTAVDGYRTEFAVGEGTEALDDAVDNGQSIVIKGEAGNLNVTNTFEDGNVVPSGIDAHRSFRTLFFMMMIFAAWVFITMCRRRERKVRR